MSNLKELSLSAKRSITKNSSLLRLIKSGKCKTEKKTKGDTKHTLESIKEASIMYAGQTKKLANALKKQSLIQTVKSNYDFLYSHIQYEADELLQKLRSPECAISQRFEGIDCKSFTLFSSTLLLNQNIKHILRRIKQPNFNPDHWSHVYVVVPLDQDKMDLKQGYYIIDATLHENKETPYLEKDDVIMSLPHVWLNGAASQEANKGYNASFEAFKHFLMVLEKQQMLTRSQSNEAINRLNNYLSQDIKPHLTDVVPQLKELGLRGGQFDFSEAFKDVDWGNLKSIFKSLSCIGGSAYSNARMQQDVDLASAIISERIEKINEAAYNNNLSVLGSEIQNFFGYVAAMNHIFIKKKYSNGWNTCTSRAINSIIDWSNKVRYIGGKALIIWIDNYYNVTFDPNNKKYYPSSIFNNLWAGYMSPTDNTQWAGTYNMVRKNPNEEVKAFVYSDYLTPLTHDNQVDSTAFLNSLSTVLIPLVNQNTGNTGGNSNNPNNNQTAPIGDTGSVNQQEAGTGTVGKVLIAGLIAGSLYAAHKKGAFNSKKN